MIILPRDFKYSIFYKNVNANALFIYCLLAAATRTTEEWGIEINRGQLLTTINNLSSKTGVKIDMARKGLTYLKRAKEIDYKKLKWNRILITVINFDKYVI